MITSWMLYTLLVGALVSVAAVVVARLAAAAGRPTRGVWAIALLASVALPAFGAVRTILAARATPVVLVPFTITVQSPVSVARANAWWLAPDRALTVLWVVLSALLFARLVRGIATLNRSRRTWRDERVDGTEVRLSENVGPAVVGLRSMDVVLPEWILSLDQPLRAIVLRHEEEHRRARDPMLLFGAELLWALMPWNLPLWFQSRRLRLAIEMDCDARVLRAHPSTERYGLLMLTIAQRRSASPLLATALSEPVTQLERRFVAMRERGRRLARVTLVAGAAVALGALVFACALQSDGPAAPRRAVAESVSPNQTYFEFQVEQQAAPLPGTTAPRYPDLLRSSGAEGDVLVQFVVREDGAPELSTLKILKSSHDLFTNAVRSSLATLRMRPARVGGRAVKQLVQMPFEFRLGGTHVGAPIIPEAGARLRFPPAPPAGYIPPTVPSTRTVSVVAVPPRANGPTRVDDSTTLRDYQVERQASPLPNNFAPRYPDALRSANIEGEVLAQFVVDQTGEPIMSTFRVVKSSHDLFSVAVRNALPMMRFRPAEVGGHPIKQLVTMPFEFSLTKR